MNIPMDERIQRAGAKRRGHTLVNEKSKAQKSLECVMMEIARGMWGRDNKLKRCESTEDRDFREFFGCGCFVASKTYAYLLSIDLFPDGGASL